LGKKDAYFHLSDVFDTGNAMVRRSVFENVGLFDRQFEKQRMGDSEFGLRSLLGGERIISNPFAKRVHLKVDTGGLRQLGSWDALRPKTLFDPRPIPSVLYLIRNYFGNKEALFYLCRTVPSSLTPYKFKGNRTMKFFGFVLLIFSWPLVLYQIMKSWNLSNAKLKEGNRISRLKIV
jgi:GT2 family glycosyltransferase